MPSKMTLRAAVVSVVLFVAFVLAWHIGTRGISAVQQMDPEYAKLMGLTATQGKSAMPGPLDVGEKLWEHLKRPFYDNGPNDKGVGIQLAYSIARVMMGYLLAVAFAIPIFLRWRKGDSWQPGGWTLGRHYKWIAPLALIEIAVTSIIALMPAYEQGVPWASDFTWSAVNYTPIVVGLVLLLITIWWFSSAKNWFKGPKVQGTAEELAAIERELAS